VLEVDALAARRRLYEAPDRLVLVEDRQPILAGLVNVGDEAPVLHGLLPLLGVELPYVRVAPAQHVHENNGQHYEDNEIEKPAASKDSAQNLFTFPECV
jgi:hypothetical protein